MKTLVVLMHDAVAGTLTSLPNGRVRFEYDSAYRAVPESTPLSLSMPLEVPVHTDQVVTPWLWGLLPDNDAVLARWGRHFQVSASSPFALLRTPIGRGLRRSRQVLPRDRCRPAARSQRDHRLG